MTVPALTLVTTTVAAVVVATAATFDWNNVFIFLIAALAAWNTFRSSQRDKTVKEATEKVKEVAETAKVIEGHVNSAATKAAAENEALRKELELMRQTIAEKNETAALLAQAVVQKADATPSEVKIVNTPNEPIPNKPTK